MVSKVFKVGKWFLVLCSLALSVATAHSEVITDGLELWLKANAGISAVDGGPVLEWGDQSGGGNHAVFNAASGYGELPPIFDASNPGAAGNPTVRFNNQHALEIDLRFLVGSDYTIFVVNSRDRFGLANFYVAGDSLLTNNNLVLGYEQPALLRLAHFANDLDAVVEDYSGTPVWSLDVFRFAQVEGRDIYHNGEHVASDDNSIPLISNTGSTLGHFRAYGNLFWFQGDLAEVLVYNRALEDNERRQIELGLADLYGLGIELTPEDMLEILAEDLTGVPPGTSLSDKITIALAYYQAADLASSCEILKAFLNQVRAQSGQKLTTAQAETFSEDAHAIRAAIGCN